MRGKSGLRLQVDAAFARAGVDRTVAFELGRSDAVVRFAGLGCGAALVPTSTAEGVGDVAVLTLDDSAAPPDRPRPPVPAPSAPSACDFVTLMLEEGAVDPGSR